MESWTSFLIYCEAASGGLLAVLGNDIRQFSFECSGVKAAGGVRLIANLERTSSKRIGVACIHMSFQLIGNALNERVKFFSHTLVLLQFGNFRDEIVLRHMIAHLS